MFCNIPFRWKEKKKGDKKEKTEIVTMEEEGKLQSQQKKKRCLKNVNMSKNYRSKLRIYSNQRRTSQKNDKTK